jgi:hypothetical protein
MYVPTMDGGRCVTDAVIESYSIINSARAMRDLPALQPKNGARFHFELPGGLQGFRAESGSSSDAQVWLENAAGHSRLGERSLAIHFSRSNGETTALVSTPTFILPEDLNMPGYSLIASPTLYPGQTVQAGFSADELHREPVKVALFVCYYDANNQPARLLGPLTSVEPGHYQTLTWQMPELQGMPIYTVGLEIRAVEEGTVYLDYLRWDGAADTTFGRPEGIQIKPNNPNLWSQAWVCAVDTWERNGKDAFRIGQNEGRGLVTTGLREWDDYYISARIRPSLMKSGGLAVRVQGLQRYYVFQLSSQKMIQLIRVFEGQEAVLTEVHFEWQPWNSYDLALEVEGNHFQGWVDGNLVVDFVDIDTVIASGAIGLLVEEGFLITNSIKLKPV